MDLLLSTIENNYSCHASQVILKHFADLHAANAGRRRLSLPFKTAGPAQARIPAPIMCKPGSAAYKSAFMGGETGVLLSPP
jgi:hypothetical protein